MELIEIVVQGLQGARELVRAPFAPGVTVFHAGPRERLFVRLVLDLLYPKGTEPTLNDIDDPESQSRVGIVVVGRDGQRYRLLIDVKTGRRALQRYVDDKAEPVTGAANEIAQAVTATIGFPQEDVLRELMFASREDLPSQRAKTSSSSSKSSAGKEAGGAKAEKPLPPGFGDTNPGVASVSKPLPPGFSDEGAPVQTAERSGRSDEQIRRRIAELDELLQSQGNVKDLEFELDGLQKKVFEIEARMRPLVTLKRSAQQAEDQLKRFTALENVPTDLVEKGERLRKVRVEHDRDVARLEDDKRKLLESARTLDKRGRQNPMEVAQRDPLVKYGVAGGVAAIAVGLVGAVSSDSLRWVALLDIPALGVAVFGGIRVLSSLEEGERIKRRVGRLDVEKKRLDDRFKIDEEQVQGVLDRHGFKLEELPDVEAQLRARDDARAMLTKAKLALADAQGGDTASLEQEQAEATARVRALEEKLSAAGAGFSNVGDLQAEKEELESLLAGGIPQRSAPFPAEASAAQVADPDAMTENLVINTAERAAYSGPERAIADDLAKRLLELTADVLLVPAEEVGTQVQARAAQILGALSDNRLRQLRFGGRGETSVVDAADDVIPFGALPAFDRDLTWLALKIALIEIVVKRGRLPVIFDRSLDFLADAKGPMLQKMLQFLAASTQVVSISEKPALGGRS